MGITLQFDMKNQPYGHDWMWPSILLKPLCLFYHTKALSYTEQHIEMPLPVWYGMVWYVCVYECHKSIYKYTLAKFRRRKNIWDILKCEYFWVLAYVCGLTSVLSLDLNISHWIRLSFYFVFNIEFFISNALVCKIIHTNIKCNKITPSKMI